eukprot:Skav219866  [mRNA]  locus=scaffold777:33085:36336:+ [translate_table: standard]
MFHILYLFSGHARKTSVAARLRELATGCSFDITVHEVDICHSDDHDMSDKEKQTILLDKIKTGFYHAILATPPCSTWTRARGANARGPPMIRSREHVWGFPWLVKKYQHELYIGNELVRFTITVLETITQCSIAAGRCWCAFFAEHPEDLGAVWREEDGKELHPASIWQLAELRALVDNSGDLQLRTTAINQCCWGAPYRKPTRLVSNLPEVQDWGPHEWPAFSEDGSYAGPLSFACGCKPQVTLARSSSDMSFRTTGTSAYPPAMDQAIAEAILAWCRNVPPPPVSEVGPVSCEVSVEEVKADGPNADEGPSDQLEHFDEKTEEQFEEKTEAKKRRKPGIGQPMMAHYKGESRPINDGGGMCSSGRWPPHRRKEVKAPRGEALCSEVRKLFLRWLAKEQSAGRDVTRRFWQMAAGKMKSSPFEEQMKELRESLDVFLERYEEDPRRRKDDRTTEVNFRRLRAALKMIEDPDADFLNEVASAGVPIGVDVELPRVEDVFEPKTKWAVEGTEEEFHDIIAENYSSAEENFEDIRRQIKEDLEAGAVVKMRADQAEKLYKGRLAVAALGAVPKEANSSRVRLIHDGSYTVDVNRRIRVRDRMRFPLVDDAAAVMASVEEEVTKDSSGIRFAMVYDIAKAHRLVPVRREDWGLQAFRMPGVGDDGVKDEDIYMHTCGTFGIASAAYWWGRCAATLLRLSHVLGGSALGLWHLLFADDGWMVAIGKWFWRKILFWFFVMDLFEFPISWKKVAGGVTCQWVGYQLDVKGFKLGISEKKQNWLRSWIEGKRSDGGALGRDMKSALGRLSFVAGALRHVRPFLGPLFAWTSMLAPGTFSAFPVAVEVLLDFIVAEVERCPMRSVTAPESMATDCFRVDAKAAGEEVVIGGWESFGGVPTSEARWFSIRLSRRTIPWAYAKGDPFRAIASLELLAVTVAVMLFSRGAKWNAGKRKLVLPAYTDNLSNMHVMKKFGSSRFPLSVVAMELACQLNLAQVELELSWVPRGQNEEADALTNERFEDFDESKRIVVNYEDLGFIMLEKLMAKAGELDQDLRLHKTSKDAKRAAHFQTKIEAPVKRRRGEMKWKDPW